MGLFRNNLPQLANKNFITDAGLETSLVFHENIDLPCFASFTLLASEQGRKTLSDYFTRYAKLAREYKAGLILESVTWRANSDWGKQLGYSQEQLREVNKQAINELIKLRELYQTADSPIVVSGNIGPRGDGYSPSNLMSPAQAHTYHREQIRTFAQTEADMVCAMTINYVEEAIGIVRAAGEFNMPVCISFTVETDGCLPTGDTLQQAIETVDWETSGYPAYYMVNCAHPKHFEHVLDQKAKWAERIYAVRCNASKRSHAELDEATELDIGNPEELGGDYKVLKQILTNLRIFGGCCGTDHRHVAQMCQTCL